MAAVIASYKASDAYRQLGPKTQRDYARHLDRFQPWDHWHITEFRRRHIKEIQKPLNRTARTAKYFAQVCSLLFAFAIDELELIEINPASKIKRRGQAKSYRAWSDEECTTFEASNPPRALLTAYMLGRFTGQRAGDILRWTRSVYNAKGAELRFRQSKGEHLGKPEMTIPVLQPLKAYLDPLPTDDSVLFVSKADGSAYDETGFRHEFRVTLDACGLRHLHFHGLRHTAGVTLAEAGASEKEIQAWLGHSTPAMAAHYCKMAEQKRLARAAGIKWTASQVDKKE